MDGGISRPIEYPSLFIESRHVALIEVAILDHGVFPVDFEVDPDLFLHASAPDDLGGYLRAGKAVVSHKNRISDPYEGIVYLAIEQFLVARPGQLRQEARVG